MTNDQDSYRETSATWNTIAELYAERFMDLRLYDESYEQVCRAVKRKHARILEIGCGPGNVAKYLLSKRPDFKLLGIDVAPNMIALARKNVPAAEFRVMDVREIGGLNAKFDALIGGFCLPYLSSSDLGRLVSDTQKLLGDEGFVYLSFVEGDPAGSGWQQGSSGDRTWFYYHRLEDVIGVLEKGGFGEQDVMHVAYPKTGSQNEVHTIVTARKLKTALPGSTI